MMVVVMLIVSYGISHYDLNSNIGVLVVLSYTWALFRLPLLSNDLYPASRRDKFWSVWYYSLLGGAWMAFLYVGAVWVIGWLRMFMYGISRGALEAWAMEVSYLFMAWLLLPVIYIIQLLCKHNRLFEFILVVTVLGVSVILPGYWDFEDVENTFALLSILTWVAWFVILGIHFKRRCLVRR